MSDMTPNFRIHIRTTAPEADYVGPVGAQLGPIVLTATSTPGPDS